MIFKYINQDTVIDFDYVKKEKREKQSYSALLVEIEADSITEADKIYNDLYKTQVQKKSNIGCVPLKYFSFKAGMSHYTVEVDLDEYEEIMYDFFKNKEKAFNYY